MDGDPVEGEPSEHKPLSLAEIFNAVFPRYLAMGMTYDEYWNQSPSLVRAYRKAWQMKREQKNYEMWMQGMYIYNALLCVAPVMRASFGGGKVEPGKYPDKPYPLTEKEVQEREAEKERENFERFLAQLKADNKRVQDQRQEVSEVGRPN